MLLVSNLFLWENVASAPTKSTGCSFSEMVTVDLFDDVIILSEHINVMSKDTFRKFVSTSVASGVRRLLIESFCSICKYLLYFQLFSKEAFLLAIELNRNKELVLRNFTSCHTSSLNPPKTKEEARQTTLPNFVRMLLSILHAWKDPLIYMEMELQNMTSAQFPTLLRVDYIKIKSQILLDRIVGIAKRVKHGLEEIGEYPVYTELAMLQSGNKDSRFFALYKLIFCLALDIQKVENYLKHLRCMYFGGFMCEEYERGLP
ncbi:prolactin-7B1-like [Psammomys obesus]|uniref:prolactin-7B1-like n=1 Tax=Psammomys obesus TaxID=48139 RepID=UPI002452BE73|nr:prolactin-7B1-like [Psammomys obesus]